MRMVRQIEESVLSVFGILSWNFHGLILWIFLEWHDLWEQKHMNPTYNLKSFNFKSREVVPQTGFGYARKYLLHFILCVLRVRMPTNFSEIYSFLELC